MSSTIFPTVGLPSERLLALAGDVLGPRRLNSEVASAGSDVMRIGGSNPGFP